MKIYFVADARLPTEKAHGLAIMKTCEALAKNGADVELVVPSRHNVLHEDPFTYYKIKRTFPLRRLWTLDLIRFGYFGFIVQEITFALSAAFFLRGKGGIVYSRDDVVLRVLSFFMRIPMIWESHTGGWNIAARTVAQRTHALVVISQGLKDFYIEKGIPSSKITVIQSAIDPDDFAHPESKESARTRLGLPQDTKIAMYIGRLDGWKGSGTLLDASHLLPRDNKIVVIGGENDQIAVLKQKYPNVVFLGFHPYSELADNQSAADVLVVPNTGKEEISMRFTSPLKLIAHMASTRPIVASDLPSIRELTGNDAAYLVPADNSEALAQGIENVLKDSALGDRLASNAKGKSTLYTWDMRAQKIIALCKPATV